MLAPCTALNTLLALATIKITVQTLSQALLLALATVKITVQVLSQALLLALVTIKVTVQALSQAPLPALLEVRHILPVLPAVQAQRKHHMGVSEHLTKRVVHSKVPFLLYIKPRR